MNAPSEPFFVVARSWHDQMVAAVYRFRGYTDSEAAVAALNAVDCEIVGPHPRNPKG